MQLETYLRLAALCLVCSLNAGCTKSGAESASGPTSAAEAPKPRVERVLNAQQQAALTPEEVVKALAEGNQRFINGTLTSRDHSKLVRDAALGQYPKAVVLSCLDSRIPVEDVFDRGIGDIFVARVAGNFENTDILGSMEFGCKVMGAKVILVLGHEHCGAIKGAIDQVELGNITAMLSNIRPAVEQSSTFEGEQSSKNDNYVHAVAAKNVQLTIDRIRERSEILRDMEAKNEIKIIGGIYKMETGVVEMISP